jgi:hypothetical protein
MGWWIHIGLMRIRICRFDECGSGSVSQVCKFNRNILGSLIGPWAKHLNIFKVIIRFSREKNVNKAFLQMLKNINFFSKLKCNFYTFIRIQQLKVMQIRIRNPGNYQPLYFTQPP